MSTPTRSSASPTPKQQAMLDALCSGNPEVIALGGFKIISAIDGLAPATQVQSVGVLFAALIEAYGLNPRSVMDRIDNILADARRTENEHIRALKLYIEGELL